MCIYIRYWTINKSDSIKYVPSEWLLKYELHSKYSRRFIKIAWKQLALICSRTHIFKQNFARNDDKREEKKQKVFRIDGGMILRLVEWSSCCLARWPSTQHTINLNRFKWKWTNYLFQRQKERERTRVYSFGIWPNSHRFFSFFHFGVWNKKARIIVFINNSITDLTSISHWKRGTSFKSFFFLLSKAIQIHFSTFRAIFAWFCSIFPFFFLCRSEWRVEYYFIYRIVLERYNNFNLTGGKKAVWW